MMDKKRYEEAEISIKYFSDDEVIVASVIAPTDPTDPTDPEITTEADDMEILPFG